jgi:hypothetical protein
LCTLFPLFNDIILGDSTVQSNQKEHAKKAKREAEGAMQKYAYQSLLSLEKHTIELTDSLHQMCCLCNDGLAVHQQSLHDLHCTVDSCSKNLYTFISRLDKIQEHVKCLTVLERQMYPSCLCVGLSCQYNTVGVKEK